MFALTFYGFGIRPIHVNVYEKYYSKYMIPVSFSLCWLLDSMAPLSYELRVPQGLHGAHCRRYGARFFPCRPSSSRFRVLLDTSGTGFLSYSGLHRQCNSPCLPYLSLLSEKG